MHKKKADITASFNVFCVRSLSKHQLIPVQWKSADLDSGGGVGDDVGSDADVSTGTTVAQLAGYR
ncbi:MAG: hypothetical protein WBA01_19920 [Phormidesmis sp.]